MLRAAKSFFSLALIICATPASGVNDDRFPQTPTAFLTDTTNDLLRAAIDQDSADLRKLERKLSAQGGFQTPNQLVDYAVALIAVGRTADAKAQLGLARSKAGDDAWHLKLIDFISFFALLRENSPASALQELRRACPPNSQTDRIVCLNFAAAAAGRTGNRELSLSAIRDLHKQVGVLPFPNDFIPRESKWDAVRVANYIVMKDGEETIWDTNRHAWQKSIVRNNYINKYDVTHAKNFADAWERLENLVKFEFDQGNYQSALDWLEEFWLEVLQHNWKSPIERDGYVARAYYGMGRQKDAEETLSEASDWFQKNLKNRTRRNLGLLDFIATINVPGLEVLSNPQLLKVWNDTATQSDRDSRLIALEAGIKLMENYSRTADLEKFEQIRQQLISLGDRVESAIPDRWPGKRFHRGWIELRTAEAILKYDPRPERLAKAAEALTRNLELAKRYVDLTSDGGPDRALELRELNQSGRNLSKANRMEIAASEFEEELIPMLGRIHARLQNWESAVPLLESAHFIGMRGIACGDPIEQVKNTVELAKVAQQREKNDDLKTWIGETKACLLGWAADSSELAWLLAQYASDYEKKNNFYAAESALSRAIWIEQKLQRPRNLALAGYLHQYVELLYDEGDINQSPELMRLCAEIILSGDRKGWSANEQTIIERQISLYAEISTTRLQHDTQLIDRAFELSQKWLRNDAGEAVEALARRKQISDERLVALIQQRDELAHQREIGDRQFSNILGTSGATEVLRLRQKIGDRIRQVDAAIKLIDERIAASNTLISVPPLTIAATRSFLSDDETLFFFVFGKSEVIRWTVDKRRLTATRLQRTSSEISEMIVKLRCGLDISAWAKEGEQKRCGNMRQPLNFDVFDQPFDVETAHELYKSLFIGVEATEQTWTIIPSGALSSLSFSVLITVPPSANATQGYEAHWLGLEHPLNILPAVSNLKSFKVGPTRAERAYIGFGNPALPGQENLPEFRSCKIRRTTFCDRFVPQYNVFMGKPGRLTFADFSPIRQTTCEICAIGEYLGLKEDEQRRDIFLSERMTKAAVKALGAPNTADGKSELQKYRVVHFATHGVMATQLAETDQPGLLMSAPGQKNFGRPEDGILTAGDIAELKLDADWVILSACNTAAGNERGGEAFSGLARAFLYAGAKSVLVSHWSVSTNAAVKLSTVALRELVLDPTQTRAHALRTAIKEIFEEGRDEAKKSRSSSIKLHPAFWGPFALIGAAR